MRLFLLRVLGCRSDTTRERPPRFGRGRVRRRRVRRHVGGRDCGGAGQADGRKSVVLVSPDVHLGGMSSGGLGLTDSGDKSVIGGLAREFYHRIWQHYQEEKAWRWQPRDRVRQRRPGHAGDGWREPHDVDLRAARGGAGVRGLGPRVRRSTSGATSGSIGSRASPRTAIASCRSRPLAREGWQPRQGSTFVGRCSSTPRTRAT